MADVSTLGGVFHVLVNDGFTWAQYEIEAATEKAAHDLARQLWSKRGEREKRADKPMPDATDAGDAQHVGGHKVPDDRDQVADDEPEDEKAPAPKTSASSSKSSSSASSSTSSGSGASGSSGVTGGGTRSEAGTAKRAG